MPKTTAFANAFLAYIFNDTAIPWEAATSSFYVSLHTASPGVAGTQATNEVSYSGYTREALARTNVDFTVSTNTATNATLVEFPQNPGSDVTITHVGIGTDASGAGNLIFFAALTSPVIVETSFVPRIPIGDLDFTET
jgi:hypothetical protein